MPTNTWLDLARRAESARGADRELDAAVLCLAYAPVLSEVRQSPINGAWCIYEPRYLTSGYDPFRLWDRAPGHHRVNGRFTDSVDAVLALIGEKLEGWEWSLTHVDGSTRADLGPPQSFLGYSEEGATPALALVRVFCLAMAAKAGEQEQVALARQEAG